MKAICLLFGYFLVHVSAFLKVQTNHDAIGIPAAKNIKDVEEASQADGNVKFEDRIIGGELAPDNAYPFFAGLQITFPSRILVTCGASLISPKRLVTAAHCNFYENRQALVYMVVLGSNSLNDYSVGERITTRRVIVHPHYNPKYLLNDIAMIYLPRNVKYSDNVKPILLPNHSELRNLFVGYPAEAVGFGKTSDKQHGVRPELSHVNLQVINNAECENFYAPNVVFPSIICTSGSGIVGICSGDSGGPLFTTDNNGNAILIGIASANSIFGCEKGNPSLFTRITSHMDFINYHL